MSLWFNDGFPNMTCMWGKVHQDAHPVTAGAPCSSSINKLPQEKLNPFGEKNYLRTSAYVKDEFLEKDECHCLKYEIHIVIKTNVYLDSHLPQTLNTKTCVPGYMFKNVFHIIIFVINTQT